MFVSISNGALCLFGTGTPCSYERTNRACDESPLCRVIPSAFAQHRVVRRLVVLLVVPVNVFATLMHSKASSIRRDRGNAFSTLRGSNARYVTWFQPKLTQPCVVRRLVVLIVVPSAWFSQAQLLVSIQQSRFMLQLVALSKLSPNTRLQRTPLRVEQDRAFFSAGICYNVLAINLRRRR